MLTKPIKIQLAVFVTIALVVTVYLALHFVKLPTLLFGVGRYTVTMELPQTGGLYERANVTYRGVEVGRVQSVNLTDTGAVDAVLSLNSGIDIPSDLSAEVHSQSAIGEQYVELVPRSASAPPLKHGDVIRLADTTVPPDINALLGATNTALQAIPRDNLKTVVDESYTAVGGLGPDLSRLVKGSTDLAIDARKNLDPLLTVIDQSQPILDSQARTSESIQAWAAHVATVTRELQTHDTAVAGVLDNGGPAVAEAQRLVERVQPTLPILFANLVSLGQVAVTYQSDIEQLLVLVPQLIANHQAGLVANLNTKQDYAGHFLGINLNLNVPPPCTTGYLPPQQRRSASLQDAPPLPPGDLYCRVPQDSPFHVRGARNIPCETVPGKRAPTVAMCESDEQYQPLNDGFNWKGDPNATLSGQDIPQSSPSVLPEPSSDPPAASPVESPRPLPAGDPAALIVPYDPTTGSYVGPDGKLYTQTNLAQDAKEQTWQSMLTPPPLK